MSTIRVKESNPTRQAAEVAVTIKDGKAMAILTQRVGDNIVRMRVPLTRADVIAFAWEAMQDEG